MKKLLIALVAILAGLVAAPAAAQTYTFTITETTGGTSKFFASFQLTGAPDIDTSSRIEFFDVAVTFANGVRNVDFVAFYDRPDGGLTFYDDGAFFLSTESVFDEQAFRRGSNGKFSGFIENGGYALQGDQNFTGRTFTLSISQTVPEPSTWAMMILGFGLAGYALRRKRSSETAGASRPELQPA